MKLHKLHKMTNAFQIILTNKRETGNLHMAFVAM